LLTRAFGGELDEVEILLGAGAGVNHGGTVNKEFIQGGTVALLTHTSRIPVPADGLVPPWDTLSGPVPNVPPLVGAVTGGGWVSHDVVRTLLAAGADPNASAGDTFYAMHAAAARGDEALVRVLLDAGALAEPPVPPGVMSPAQLARASGHEAVAALIEQPR
jgi:hypothetical protein